MEDGEEEERDEDEEERAEDEQSQDGDDEEEGDGAGEEVAILARPISNPADEDNALLLENGFAVRRQRHACFPVSSGALFSNALIVALGFGGRGV